MIYLLLPLLLGLAPAAIAHSKGRDFFLWWVYGAAIFIVALPHALVMKPDEASLEQQRLQNGQKKCPFCAELVREEAVVCRHCGRSLGDESLATTALLQPVANTKDDKAPAESSTVRSVSASDDGAERIVLGLVSASLVAIISVAVFTSISSTYEHAVSVQMPTTSNAAPTPIAPPQRVTALTERQSTAAATTAVIATPTPSGCTEVSQHGFIRFLVCDPNADATDWRRAGMEACKGRSVCKVWMWDRIEKAGTSLPMTDSEVNSAVAVWTKAGAELRECRRVGC